MIQSHKQLTRIVTTKPAMSSSAAALRIPTIQLRKVIAPQQQQRNNAVIDSSQRAPHQSTPPIMEKICGLFDLDVSEPTITTENLDMDENNVNFDSSLFNFADIINDQSNNLTSPQSTTILSDLPTTPIKKTFSQKLNEANLKIKIVKPELEENMLGTPMNLDLDDTDLAKLFTPNTENMCMQLLHSMPLDAVEQQPEPAKSMVTTAGDQLLSSLSLLPTETVVVTPVVQHRLDTSHHNPAVDHMYSVSNKRPLDDDDDDESVFSSTDDLNSSMTAVATPSTSRSTTSKKSAVAKRARGIYRAEDVTNENDLANYLERRKKNNISSKVSRANKKTYYVEMEAKSQAIADQNAQLRVKIVKLEKVNKIMKDFLKDAFVDKLRAE